MSQCWAARSLSCCLAAALALSLAVLYGRLKVTSVAADDSGTHEPGPSGEADTDGCLRSRALARAPSSLSAAN